MVETLKKIELASIANQNNEIVLTSVAELPSEIQLYAQKRAWKVDNAVENVEVVNNHTLVIHYGEELSQFTGRGIFDLFAEDGFGNRYNFVDMAYLGKSPIDRYHDMGESVNNPFDYQLYTRTDGRLAIIVDPKVQTDTNRLAIKYNSRVESVEEKNDKIVVRTTFTLHEWSVNSDTVAYEPAMFVLRAPNQAIVKPETVQIDANHWESVYDKAAFGEFGQWAFGMILSAGEKQFYLQIRGTTRELYDEQQAMDAKTWFTSTLPGIVLDKQFMSNRAFILRARPETQLETAKVQRNLKIALALYKLIGKRKSNNGKRLVFEREAWFAQDNAFSLFKKAVEEQQADELLYVINADSPAYERAKQVGGTKVIAQYSVSYFLELMAAKELVTSIFPLELLSLYKTSGALVDKIRHTPVYYLGHGVLALKRMGVDYRRSSKLFDRVLVGSTFDFEAHRHLGFKSKELRKIGYPRWDDLKGDQKSDEKKHILFFPTWRGWVDKLNDEEFVQSEYFSKIQELMNSNKMQALLNAQNAVLDVYLHPNMRRFTNLLIDDNAYQNVNVLNPDEVSVAEIEVQSDMIISDYSSVVWDFAVQKKPVVFYQFDREQYQTMVNGYFELTELPVGTVTETVEGVIAAVENYLSIDSEMTTEEKEWVDANFYGLSGSAKEILDDILSVSEPKKITSRDDSFETYEAVWKK